MLDSLDELRLFCAVYECCSIRQAAELLNMTPAAGSKRLLAMENRLGLTLFYRTTRTLSPTANGESLYHHAKSILQAAILAEQGLHPAKAISGKLKITTSASFSQSYLDPMISQYLTLHPHVRIEVLATDDPINLIERGIDLAIRHGPLRDSSLIGQKLSNSGRVLCASPKYLDTSTVPTHPEELTNHSLLVVGKEPTWQFEPLTPKAGEPSKVTVKLRPRYSSTLGESILQMALDGHGIAVLSDWHVRDDIQKGHLVPLLSAWSIVPTIAIHALYPSRINVSPVVRNFIEYLKDWVNKHPI